VGVRRRCPCSDAVSCTARDATIFWVPHPEWQNILQVPIVTLRPEVKTVRGVDELGGDSHAVSGFANAALQDVAYAELSAHLFGSDCLTLVRERGVAGDDEQTKQLGEARDEILGDPI